MTNYWMGFEKIAISTGWANRRIQGGIATRLGLARGKKGYSSIVNNALTDEIVSLGRQGLTSKDIMNYFKMPFGKTLQSEGLAFSKVTALPKDDASKALDYIAKLQGMLGYEKQNFIDSIAVLKAMG